MKKILIVLLLMVSSCAPSDTSEIQRDEELLVGVWQPIKEITISSGGVRSEIEWTSPARGEGICAQKDRVEFLSNSNFENDAYSGDNINNCSQFYDDNFIHSLTGNNSIIGTNPELIEQWSIKFVKTD